MPGATTAVIVLRHFGFVATLVGAALLSPATAQNPGPLYTVTTVAGATLPPYAGNGDGGLALNARVAGESLARDSKGTLYIGERGTGRVRKIDPSGAITTIAGPGVPGFSADGAAGTIQLGFSLGIAVDAADALIVADTDHHRVLRLDASGAVSTIAGTGAPGSSGDGGPAASATLTLPFGLAFDRAGNLFIGEYSTGRVRRVTRDGVIATVAQHACPRANCNVWGLAVDGAGNLYIADGISTIAKMTPDGAIATIAGSDSAGFSGDGGPAVSARFYAPSGIALDGGGNLYVADTQNQRIRKISPEGTVTTVAGNGFGGFTGEVPPTGGVRLGRGRDATTSQLQFPVAVLPDGSGNLYIAEQSLVRKVDAAGRLYALAGTNAPGEGGPATAAELRTPASLAMDAAGNIYFSDASANRVRRIGADGTLATVAGTGEQGYEGDGGPATAAVLNGPLGIALDAAGNLYVADNQNQCVRKIGADGVIRTVVARGAGAVGTSDGGLFIPTSLAVDRSGNLYIADPLEQRVRKLAPDGTVTTFAGGGAPADNLGNGGPATAAFLQHPEGIALDAAGNLYIADTGQHRVRKVSPAGVITTVAGKGNERLEPVRDGIPALAAYLPDLASVAVDANGNVFISDRYDNSVRVVGVDGIISTLAGYGVNGGLDGGPAFAVGLASPHGIVADAAGGLYVAEGDSIYPGRVRRIAPQFATGGTPQLWAVLNGGSWLRGEPFSPGAIVRLFGVDLGPIAGVTNRADSSGRYSAEVSGVRVLFNGVPGPILYAQAYRVDVVVPFAVPLGTAVKIELIYNGRAASQHLSNIASGCCVAALPELIRWSASPRTGQAAALNEDGSINSAENPAAAGSIVSLYATGAGAMDPPLQDGVVVTDTNSRPVVPLTVRIGGVTADVLYAGPAPGLIAGVLQINARVPQTFVPVYNDPSATPVFLLMGQLFSSLNGTIAVRY
jgi:trimeric autotransporter adhesin